MQEGLVLPPGGGETITERAARTVQIKVGADAIAVIENRYEVGEAGPDAHVHRRHTDAFYVLEGELLFELGPDRRAVRAGAGAFVAAPPGVVHSFRNDGPGRVRFLNFHAPSERFHEHLRGMRAGEDTEWFDQFDPPPDGGRPLADATVHAPAAGERLEVARSSVVLKGTGATTDGMFFLSETTLAPGFAGPPPHVHARLHDLFYVLAGTLLLRSGDETIAAPPGTFACFPPGAVHSFSTSPDDAARFLNFNTPAGWEGYMRDLAAASAGDRLPTPAEVGAITSRYDFDVVH